MNLNIYYLHQNFKEKLENYHINQQKLQDKIEYLQKENSKLDEAGKSYLTEVSQRNAIIEEYNLVYDHIENLEKAILKYLRELQATREIKTNSQRKNRRIWSFSCNTSHNK